LALLLDNILNLSYRDMKKYLKENWMIYPVPIFSGLLIGFTDLSDSKKMIYIIVF